MFLVSLILLMLSILGCVATTPAGSLTSTEPHILVKVQRGDHITEISFQGDSVILEKDMMFDVIDKIQDIHKQNQNDK